MESKIVKIVNYKQASYYISKGVKPVNLEYTNKIIFIFKQEDTTDVWNAWKMGLAEI